MSKWIDREELVFEFINNLYILPDRNSPSVAWEKALQQIEANQFSKKRLR